VTTLAINALGASEPASNGRAEYLSSELIEWVEQCQHTEKHPFTGASPGGWAWSDLSGAVPDADDTPGALLALSVANDQETSQPRMMPARAFNACVWLFGLQNSDGGWPTFCRGWGVLPFDRSGTDLTAHALRAISVWKPDQKLAGGRAIERGFRYLAKHQRRDGSWLPLWFGNQHRPDDENPLYGTSRVLLAYRDLRRMDSAEARRGIAYLLTQQNADGGWGGTGLGENQKAETRNQKRQGDSVNHGPRTEDHGQSSVEETAVVVEALLGALPYGDSAANAQVSPDLRVAIDRGVRWLIEGVESGRFREASPIGFYFAKLWYYEKLYPLIFTVSALRHATERSDRPPT